MIMIVIMIADLWQVLNHGLNHDEKQCLASIIILFWIVRFVKKARKSGTYRLVGCKDRGMWYGIWD